MDKKIAASETESSQAKTNYTTTAPHDKGKEIDLARDALYSVPPSIDRDTWWKVAAGAKAAGLSLDDFNEWSSAGDNYDGPEDCRRVWNSIDADGPITPGTLYGAAKAYGWQQLTQSPPQSETTWVYQNESGTPVYRVKRSYGQDGKRKFTQERYESGQWVSGIKGIPPLPYRLPDLVNYPDDPVYIVEGEKDADNLAEAGLLATTNNGGAGNWKSDLNQYLADRDVVIVHDNDNPGRKHADKISAGLDGIAKSVKVLDLAQHFPSLPEKGDISDLLAQGVSVAELREIAAETATESAYELLCDLEQSRACHLMQVEPAPQRYVIDGMLPEPIAAAIVAPGGTGKSFMTMQVACSVASGIPYMGHRVESPGGVLMLAAEDDQDELSRRLHAVVNMLRQDLDMTEEQTEALGDNFYPVSRLAEDNRVTHKVDGAIQWNHSLIRKIIETARSVDNLRLIILDPVSRFRSGDENASEDATKFVEALELIRRETGVTVLCVHHSRKGSIGESQDDIRGASAFVDALRFAATLYTPTPSDAKKLGIDPPEARTWVRYKVVKSNYRTDVDELWMRRGTGGVLTPTDPPEPQNKAAQNGQERYLAALPKLKSVIRKADQSGHKLTKRKLCTEYAGAGGIFGCGDQSLRGVVERAITEGDIKRDGDGNLTLY